MKVQMAVLGFPYGFCGRKTTLNRASALVTVCPQYVNRHPTEEMKLCFTTPVVVSVLRSCVRVEVAVMGSRP